MKNRARQITSADLFGPGLVAPLPAAHGQYLPVARRSFCHPLLLSWLVWWGWTRHDGGHFTVSFSCRRAGVETRHALPLSEEWSSKMWSCRDRRQLSTVIGQQAFNYWASSVDWATPWLLCLLHRNCCPVNAVSDLASLESAALPKVCKWSCSTKKI